MRPWKERSNPRKRYAGSRSFENPSQGPYGQLVASQVDESVPSSYQKSPRLSQRARASALQQRPSSLPVVALVDRAVCERPANLTPTSSMLVTPENPSVDPPISPIVPIASHSSRIYEDDAMVEAQITNLKEKELRSKLRAKRAKLEAKLTGGRKSQNSSNSCGSRERVRRRIENVQRLGSSVHDLSPSSRMQLSNADESSVIDSRIDEED